MTTHERDFSRIPAEACTFVVGEFEIGDNGENAKTAPVRLVARSGQPIEHWFWGRIVHDMAGMHLHKSRLPIDYVHDSKEVIGYLNRFDTTSGDLITSGALVPFKDSDRATEIVHKARNGVPYEASINFGGDGLKIQELQAGEMADVNGMRFEGPGVIVREWPLRGVAICPYGADMNTDTSVLKESNKVFSAAVVAAPDAATKEIAVSDPVAVVAEAQAPVAEKELEVKPVEVNSVETVSVAEPSAPVAVVETEIKEGECGTDEKGLSRDEVTKIADEFGADIAVQTVRDGGDYGSALRLAYDSAKSEIKALRERVAELIAKTTGQPVPVAVAKEKGGLFKTGK
jgi:hypothetical protein